MKTLLPSLARFIVSKDNERSEVKVQEGPEGFPFLHGEEYIFKYSFKAVEGMKVHTINNSWRV